MNKNQQLLRNKHAVATPLTILVVDRFGTECLEWEQEVMNEEMEKMAGGPVPPLNFDKVAAITEVLTSDRFFNEPKVFGVVCNAIGGEDDGPVMFTAFDPPFPEECAWGVFEALVNRPLSAEEDADGRFGQRVQTYIGAILKTNGFLTPPKPLDFIDFEVLPTGITQDDVAMAEAVWDIQGRNNELIRTYVVDRMKLLLGQLSDLQLSSGTTEEAVKRLSKFL